MNRCTDAPDVTETSHCKSATSVAYSGREWLFKQNCPENSFQLSAVSLFCPMCSWCIVYGEGMEQRSGWTNKGGELASPQSMVIDG